MTNQDSASGHPANAAAVSKRPSGFFCSALHVMTSRSPRSTRIDTLSSAKPLGLGGSHARHHLLNGRSGFGLLRE